MIYADDVQIMQVLQNLISNAIKFHGDEAPIIHIGCEDVGGRFLFSVRDNGIGIDPAYKDRVLVLFQRLNSREQYEGTGIGLAITKKIMERSWRQDMVRVRGRQGNYFLLHDPSGA